MAECFLPQNHIMHQLSRIKHLPAYIIQGRHDVICPPFSAYGLAEKWGPNAHLQLVDDAGHSAFEPGIINGLLKALDNLSADNHFSYPV